MNNALPKLISDLKLLVGFSWIDLVRWLMAKVVLRSIRLLLAPNYLRVGLKFWQQHIQYFEIQNLFNSCSSNLSVIWKLAWLHFFWKCGVRQCGLGKVSTGHKKNLSHFYISKKFWKPCQTFGRLVLAVWSRADWLVFFKVSRTFLKYENGSNFFYELLRSILTYTELPHIFEKKVITLLFI